MDAENHLPIPHAVVTLPPRLRPGDTIGIAAPAGCFDRDALDCGIACLSAMGFKTVVPESVFQKNGYLAGPDESRAAEINRLFADSRIDAVMCARGGFGSLRTLPFLDYDLIRRNPKIFIGFSDITAIIAAFFSRCGMTAFHGPTVLTLAESDMKTREALREAVSGRLPVEIAADRPRVVCAGTAAGRVIGGNLTTLCHLIGTGYFPDLSGKILLLEDRGEAPYRIDRMLTQMKMAGCLDGLAGVLLGSFDDCGETEDIYGIFTAVFQDGGIPVLGGFPIGHGRRNVTVPIGVEAVLDADRLLLCFQRPATAGPDSFGDGQ